MTDNPTPTDAELIAELEVAGVAFMKFRGGLGGTKEVWTTSGSQDAKKIAQGMRAAIAKWGQPAQAAEPVAWLRNTTDPQPHAVTNLKYRSAADTDAGIEYIPVYTTSQHGEREPLTDVQIKDGHTGMPRDVWAFADGVRFAEQHHGIKGGQHVE